MIASDRPGSKKKFGLERRGEISASEGASAVPDVAPHRRTAQLDMLPLAAFSGDDSNLGPTCIEDAIAEVVGGSNEVEQPAKELPQSTESTEPDDEQPTSHMVNLPIASLISGKNGRGEVDDVGDLKASFKHSPQLQNIIVRPVDGSAEKYEIIGGHRRVEALRQLGRTHVEARVFETDEATAELYGLEENLRRKALADEGAALARAKELYEAQGATGRGGDRRSSSFVSNGHGGRKVKSATAQLAALTGKSERQVRREIRVAEKGEPELKQALAEGDVTKNEAETIAGQPPEVQRQEVVARRTEKRKTGAPAVLRAVERSLAKARTHLAAVREETTSAAGLSDLIGRLKATAATLVLEVEALESAAASVVNGTVGEGQP